MIDKVTWEKTTFERLPFKFEAGTPDYVATHGLATAIDYLERVGLDSIYAHEQSLTHYCMEQLQTIDGMTIYGPNYPVANIQHSTSKDAVVSFNVGNIHHLDMGTLLDRLGIAVRTGHHCAQPLMDRLGITGTVRASFALYNTKEEVDALVAGIRRISKMFSALIYICKCSAYLLIEILSVSVKYYFLSVSVKQINPQLFLKFLNCFAD